MSFPMEGLETANEADMEFNMVVNNDPLPQMNPVEDEFTRSVRDISAQLGTVAGKVSEAGIRRLAAANGFEVFEEELAEGKRVSLGGTIILIDIDFSRQDKVMEAKLSLGSTVGLSDDKKSFTSKEIPNKADDIVTGALKQPLLGEFCTILQHLSRSDQLSVPPQADNFACMDELAIALMKKSSNDPLGEYGVVRQNLKQHLGMGIHYWTRHRHLNPQEDDKCFAMLSVMPLDHFEQDKQFAIKYSTSWLNENNEWNDPEPMDGAKGCFVLGLDPPVVMPRSVARRINCIWDSPREIITEEGLQRVRRTVHKPNGKEETLSFIHTQTLTDPMVLVDFVKLAHPRDIPQILQDLRRYQLLWTLWTSITSLSDTAEDTATTTQEQEISFADAIMDYDDVENLPTSNISLLLTENAERHPVIKLGAPEVEHTLEISITDQLRVRPELDKLQKALEMTEDLAMSICFVSAAAAAGGQDGAPGRPRENATAASVTVTTKHPDNDKTTNDKTGHSPQRQELSMY